MPAGFDKAWRSEGLEPPIARQHPSGLFALVGREPWPGDPDPRWHISLRYGERGRDGRVPSWDELVESVHALRPGVPFVVGIPPRSWWMSIHPDVLHAWETRDKPLIAEWKRNRALGQGRDQ